MGSRVFGQALSGTNGPSAIGRTGRGKGHPYPRSFDCRIGAEGPHAELLHIEEALFECPTDLQRLIQGDVPVRRITIRRPTLRMTRRRDGTWSTARLLPPPKFGEHPPDVIVEGGVIEVFDPLKVPASNLTVRDVNISLVPMPAEPGAAGANSHKRKLEGMFAGDGFRRVEVGGWVDLEKPACSIHGQAEGLEISPELRDSLPNPLGDKLRWLPDLRAQIDLRFELSYDPAAKPPLKYDISGPLSHGRIDDTRLPHALSDIRAVVHVNNSGYTIQDLMARNGQGTVRLDCRRSGFDSSAPLQLSAEVRQLDLDRALLNVLPESLQDHWYKYRPTGEVDADVQLSFDGKVWRPDITVRCLNVSFKYHKFLYQLDHGRGTVELKGDLLKMNLTAYGGTQQVRLAAELAHPFTGWTGRFEAKGEDFPLDETLFQALPAKPQEVVRSLNPHGSVNFDLTMWRRPA